MINILDIIQHENKYSTQTMIVTDFQPAFLYEKINNLLIGEDSGFFYFYKYETPSKDFSAFSGRKFEIPLKTGGHETAKGQWWKCTPDDYIDLVYGVGVASVDELEKCYVFYSMAADRLIVDQWLEKHETSNNYNKYNKKSSDYGVHRIKHKWRERLYNDCC